MKGQSKDKHGPEAPSCVDTFWKRQELPYLSSCRFLPTQVQGGGPSQSLGFSLGTLCFFCLLPACPLVWWWPLLGPGLRSGDNHSPESGPRRPRTPQTQGGGTLSPRVPQTQAPNKALLHIQEQTSTLSQGRAPRTCGLTERRGHMLLGQLWAIWGCLQPSKSP